MKKTVLVVAMVMMIFSASFAKAEEEITKPEPMFSVSGELFVRSAYVGDDGSVYYRGLVIQPSIIISHNPSGFYIGMWGSGAPGKNPTSDNGEGNNFGNEVDFLAGWGKEIGKATINFDYAYYKLFPLNKWGTGDIHSISVKVGYALTEKVNPYVKVIYDHVVDQAEQNGFIYRFGAVFSLHEHLKVDISFGGHGPIFGAREEWISSGKISVSFPYDIVKDKIVIPEKFDGVSIPVREKLFTIVPEISYQQRFGYEVEDGGLAESILYAGLGCTF
ncbi:MAG TPA: hypothetical protein PLB52_01390 [Candidatus Moranbacteria bacterium]|nr:hypothetical protein [Candidatus Moranbacteria bacterium]